MNAETLQSLLTKAHRNDILLGHIATGGFGSVWLLRDPVLNRLEALKVVERAPDPNTERDKPAMELTGVQTYTATIPSHPHLVTVHDALQVDGTFLYFMEAADNVAPEGAPYQPDTLLHRIQTAKRRGEPLAIETIRSLFLALLEGIEALHAKGIYHRDIKLENVIFINGVPKLTDMGGVTDPARTALPDLIATPAYTPRYRDRTDYHPADHDLYALGILLYSCLTGFPPEQFPKLPPDFLDNPVRARLNRFLVERACTDDQELRYRTVAEWRSGFLAAFRNTATRRRWLIGGICVLFIAFLASFIETVPHPAGLRIPDATFLYADSEVARPDRHSLRWRISEADRRARLLLYWPEIPVPQRVRFIIKIETDLPDLAIWTSFYPGSLNLCVNLSGTWKEIGFLWNSLAIQQGRLILAETRERNYVRDLALCQPPIPVGNARLIVERDGPHIVISLDGQPIIAYDDPDLSLKKNRFLLGFQSSAAGELTLRSIRQRTLTNDGDRKTFLENGAASPE